MIPTTCDRAWTNYAILAALAPLAQTYLGVGVQEGGCVEQVVQAHPTINLTLCDTWGPHHGGTNRGSHAHIDALLQRVGHRGSVTYLDGLSQDLIPALPLTRFDLTYVDGGHDTPTALSDLTHVWPRTGVVLVVHDVYFPGVWMALTCWLGLIPARELALLQIVPAGTGTGILWRQA